MIDSIWYFCPLRIGFTIMDIRRSWDNVRLLWVRDISSSHNLWHPLSVNCISSNASFRSFMNRNISHELINVVFFLPNHRQTQCWRFTNMMILDVFQYISQEKKVLICIKRIIFTIKLLVSSMANELDNILWWIYLPAWNYWCSHVPTGFPRDS